MLVQPLRGLTAVRSWIFASMLLLSMHAYVLVIIGSPQPGQLHLCEEAAERLTTGIVFIVGKSGELPRLYVLSRPFPYYSLVLRSGYRPYADLVGMLNTSSGSTTGLSKQGPLFKYLY